MEKEQQEALANFKPSEQELFLDRFFEKIMMPSTSQSSASSTAKSAASSAEVDESNSDSQQERQQQQQQQQQRGASRVSIAEVARTFAQQAKSEKYKRMLQARQGLPAFQMKDEILNCITNNQVCVCVCVCVCVSGKEISMVLNHFYDACRYH